jgi:nitrile hydratase accessory protein
MTRPTASIDALPALPRDHQGPVFDEPWQAEAFALAIRLSEAGYFTWSEWTAVFSQEIKAAQERGDPDLGNTYYHHWLNALEHLCAAKGLVSLADLEQRKKAWQRAYLNTPHGQPVELSAALKKRA